MNDRWTQILKDVEKLKSLEVGTTHGFTVRHIDTLNPPLPESSISRFEATHKISLPEDYREFLMHVGNGGIGPSYGLERLGEMYGVSWSETAGLVGELSRPFPYTDAWNVLQDDSLPEDEQWRQQDDYWSAHHVSGAIPICDHGDNLRECLIVTGSERGNMWFDDRADWKGLYPSATGNRNRLTLFDWYRSWLDISLANAASQNVMGT